MVKEEKSAGAVIFYMDKEPKFLLLKYTNYWGFMKGNIETNETIEQTMAREMKEETNISKFDIIKGFTYTQTWFYKLNNILRRKFASYFLVEITKEEIKNVKISEEHEDFKFLELEEALKIMKVKANKEMLIKAHEFIKENKKQKTLV